MFDHKSFDNRPNLHSNITLSDIVMKEKIGIALLILLNSGFIYLLIIFPFFEYGMINGRHGLKAIETANHVAQSLLKTAILLSSLGLVINYIIFRLLISSKKPLIYGLIVTILGIAISIPFFLNEKQRFIERQYSQIMLSDYIPYDSISEIRLFTSTDTIPIAYYREFVQIIGNASYAEGIWKYQKSLKIMIRKTDGTKDSIISNGELFELSNGKFFKANEDLVEKYLLISHSENLKSN